MLGSKCRKVVFGFACLAGSALLMAADGQAAAASGGLRAIAAALAIGLELLELPSRKLELQRKL